MNTSADLVTRVCQGDADAFRLIFERYSRPVISFIYDMVNDRGLAEELTQETFVRAFRAIHTMRAETKLSTWLFGIARNVARESLRARARANTHVDLADKSVMDLSDDKPVPVEGLLSKELNTLVRRSLATLDEDKRLVFTLKVLHQCSYTVAGEQLITADAADTLNKRVRDINKALRQDEQDKVAEETDKLREDFDKAVADGEILPDGASRLDPLLQKVEDAVAAYAG